MAGPDSPEVDDHPHRQLAHELWIAVADGDVAGVRRLLDDDVVWRSAGRNPLSGDHHGHAGVLDYLSRVGDSSDEFRSSLEGVWVNEDGAVVRYHVSARRGECELEMDYLLVLRIEALQVVRALSVPVDQRVNDAFWNG